MRKLGILFTVALIGLTGCATNSDITKLQSEIDVIESNQKTLVSELADTNKAVTVLNVKTDAAVKAALMAEQYCKDINTKLDRLFKKSQLK
jgi:murein lipoprotein